MAIKIGNNNKFKNTNIIDNSNCTNKNEDNIKDSFENRHPILTGIICSIVASIIMMFTFWEKVSEFIRNLF